MQTISSREVFILGGGAAENWDFVVAVVNQKFKSWSSHRGLVNIFK